VGTWAETLDALVRERGGALYGYAFVLTGERRAAERLLHHALARTFRTARGNMPIGAAHAYVKRAMRLQVYAGHGFRAHVMPPAHDAPDPFAPDAAPASGTETDLHEAILTLPPRERTCAVMRYFDGLSVNQIARELDAEPASVRATLTHAAATLNIEHADLGFAPESLGDGDSVTIIVEVKDTKR
jgi:RNA polymerase sigma factor (sigma-70 family)